MATYMGDNDNDLSADEVSKILGSQASIENATEAIVRYILALKDLRMPVGNDAVRKIRKAAAEKVA